METPESLLNKFKQEFQKSAEVGDSKQEPPAPVGEVKEEGSKVQQQSKDAEKTVEPKKENVNVDAKPAADDEYKSKLSTYERENLELKKKLDELKGYFEKIADPKSYFSSEDAYKVEQLKKVKSGIHEAVAKAAVGDIEKLSVSDLLVYDILLDVPNLEGGREGAEELIMEKYGIESFEDIPRAVKNKMLLDANRVKQKLVELKNSIPAIERPKILDEVFGTIENEKAVYEQLVNSWTQNIGNVSLNSIVLKPNDGSPEFSFSVDAEFAEMAKKELPKLMASYGLDPKQPEALERAKAELRVAYLASNFERIAEEYANYRVTQALDKFRKENAGMVTKPKEGEPVVQTDKPVSKAIEAAKKAGLRI